MKLSMTYVTILKVLRMAEALTISVQKWSPVTVSENKENFLPTPIEDAATLVMAADKCLEMEDCKLICQIDGNFTKSSLEVIPEYHEFDTASTHQCWTKLPREVVGSKKSDGLYYILHVEVVHSFNEIIKACRKYYGYRLAIARDKTTFDTMLSLQYTDGGVKMMFVGLRIDPDSLEYYWYDGTSYDTTISPPVYISGQHGTTFVMWGPFIDDYPEILGAGYMCQANPDGISNY